MGANDRRLLFIPRRSRSGIPAEIGSSPGIPAGEMAGRGDRRSQEVREYETVAQEQRFAALAEEFPYLAEVVAGHVAKVGYDFGHAVRVRPRSHPRRAGAAPRATVTTRKVVSSPSPKTRRLAGSTTDDRRGRARPRTRFRRSCVPSRLVHRRVTSSGPPFGWSAEDEKRPHLLSIRISPHLSRGDSSDSYGGRFQRWHAWLLPTPRTTGQQFGQQ